jgi:hypothetical protein
LKHVLLLKEIKATLSNLFSSAKLKKLSKTFINDRSEEEIVIENHFSNIQ